MLIDIHFVACVLAGLLGVLIRLGQSEMGQ